MIWFQTCSEPYADSVAEGQLDISTPVAPFLANMQHPAVSIRIAPAHDDRHADLKAAARLLVPCCQVVCHVMTQNAARGLHPAKKRGYCLCWCRSGYVPEDQASILRVACSNAKHASFPDRQERAMLHRPSCSLQLHVCFPSQGFTLQFLQRIVPAQID